ncbi:hypothetical protein [Mycobacterium sp.]|uniref:hypothetical protein n=1 Tax=Mycobacterium sp. TaxID=1785 RepID=UPI002C515EDF|nr:hypothetical protein [Mycobacterium sp.]HKP39683.1 hypothetical protein [Mycobacterium sp.]
MRVNQMAAMLIAALAVGGCSDVTKPISPEQARAQVMDAARDILNTLHADVVSADFLFDSCGDEGRGPYRGRLKLWFWTPADHSTPVPQGAVIEPLTASGWRANVDAKSHAATLTRNGIDAIVTVAPQTAGNGHAGVDVLGECRDTHDHNADHTAVPEDVTSQLQKR